jgi:hypothetical protein
MSGTYDLTIKNNSRFPHVIVAAPDNDPNQWILSWEDLPGSSPTLDMDYNDITFRIERKTGGAIALDGANAIIPADTDAFYTAVTFGVYDLLPDGACAGQTSIDYHVSIDNGVNWVQVRDQDWDSVQEYTLDNGDRILGADVAGWSPGVPAKTYREIRIDFAGLGLVGRELVWKATLTSDAEGCEPKVYGANISGSTNAHGVISRSSPIKLSNMLYTGSYETPAIDWVDRSQPRGHVRATRLYDPSDPSVTDTEDQWPTPSGYGSGWVLQDVSPAARTIYYPDITTATVPIEALTVTLPDGSTTLAVSDGATATFTGQLANAPVLATTVKIAAGSLNGTLVFTDAGTDLLDSSVGSGTINRFTGEFQITFNTPPPAGLPFVAAYGWYSTANVPKAFSSANIDNQMLALDNTPIIPSGYKYDLDGDGDFDEQDGDWLVEWVRGYEDGRFATVERSWKLGAIDHSVPALMTPPSIPEWYTGTAITQSERSSYDAFKLAQRYRDTVLFVGARDGMLHAFDAGKFRYGDNPLTAIKEESGRGYFLWEDLGAADGILEPNYGTGEELWSFIPANLIPRFKNNLLQGDDRAYVDASASLAQVQIGGVWKTVLLMAEGNGGDSIFCLDVTDPANPLFLWEYADPDLFRSRSSPSIGQIGLIQDGATKRWAAFFVSGKSSDPTAYPSIYMVDVADGSVIQKILLDSDPGGVGGIPSGQPALMDIDENGYLDRLYVGTDKGRMYRVNLPDDPGVFWNATTVDDLVINGDFIDDDGTEDAMGNPLAIEVPVGQRWHPIYASPTVTSESVIDGNGYRQPIARIFFGTGDSPYADENIDTGNTTYHFFAYVDRAPKTSKDPALSLDPSQVELEWFFDLPAGERIFATAFASAGRIYFGTATSETEDPCGGPNDGGLYVFNAAGYGLDTPAAPVTRLDTGDVTSSPLVDDEHLFVRSPSGLKVHGGDGGSGGYNKAQKISGFGEAKATSWRETAE